MEARRRRLGADVVRRAVPLDLIDAIERHVEAIAALVLDDRDFDCALADEHLLDPAIDTDTVLEMNDVVAWLERSEAFERAARRITTCPAKAPLAAKDFVVGENPISLEPAVRWNDEAAIENTDRQASRRHAIIVQQLVEPLGLTGI